MWQQGTSLLLDDPMGLVRGRYSNQLAYWGFVFDPSTKRFCRGGDNASAVGRRVVEYLASAGITLTVADELARELTRVAREQELLAHAREAGKAIKEGRLDSAMTRDFRRFLSQHVIRRLKEHQLKAALHLLAVGNGANFSVPGSGKTTVALVVYEYLRRQNIVNCLFVVGPPSCFAPWRTEYEKTLGRRPTLQVLAGGDAQERRRAYFEPTDNRKDLYLTSFQTLQRDADSVKSFFMSRGILALLIVDEAHYIKQGGGAWATAVLDIAPHAVRRVVLTGTPFPQGYADAFNLADALWPNATPLIPTDRARITHGPPGDDVAVLDEKVGPLFYRVRKRDLHLTPPDLRAPTVIAMNEHERRIYDAIVSRLRAHPLAVGQRDWDALVRLRRGRLIRLRQCASYPALLRHAIDESDEDLTGDNPSLTALIREYDQLETPAKLSYLDARIDSLRTAGEKVLIWSTFVGTLKLIRDRLQARGHPTGLIYGATPVAADLETEELSREQIIGDFLDPGGLGVLVANPAACAESISLHTACSHAIYYDLSYNCAQYLQSLDRIHRVGGSEHRVAHYEFLQCAATIDQDILQAVRRKAARMELLIDQDYPIYSLDMAADDADELSAYERVVG